MADKTNISIDTMKDNVKNTLNKSLDVIKSNPTAAKVISRIDADRKRVMDAIKKNPVKWLTIILGIFLVAFYFIVFFKRIPRFLRRMKVYKNDGMQPLVHNHKIMKSDFRLCDFYVASSYKSYLPCTNYYDYASLEAIEKVLMCGARYIDLDVFNDCFNRDTKPVVCEGTEVGNWHWTNSIPFQDVCHKIATTAFCNKVKNASDPLFININFKTWGNKKTIDKCADIIKRHFNAKLLPKYYSYQGRYTSANIATIPIREVINKVIIISSGDISDTEMDELTNLKQGGNSNFRDLTHNKVKETYDAKELRDYNKRNLTRVTPDFENRFKENYNFFTAYALGCQFMCMNYTEPTNYMKMYATKFSECGLLLKPYKLRYRPLLIPAPRKQDKRVSFAAKKKSTPFYSITY